MSFNFDLDDSFMNELTKLGDSSKMQDITSKMLSKGSEPVKKEWEKEMSKHVVTHSLVDSIKTSKPKQTRNGGLGVAVFPSGTDSKGVRNAEKAVYLENGTYKQAAQPFLQKIKDNTENDVINIMQKVFDEEIGD